MLPATARWWLDFYAGLATHLASHGELVADVRGRLPDLRARRRQPQRASRLAGRSTRPRASVEQLRDFLEGLVDERHGGWSVLEVEDGVAPALAPLRTDAPAGRRDSPEGTPCRSCAARLLAGAEYLVVPRDALTNGSPSTGAVAAEIEENCRNVADQRHLCRVFELNEREERYMK